MSGKSALQKRNGPMVDLLSADFQKRYEPNFASANAISSISLLPALRCFWPFSSTIYDGANRYVVDQSSGYNLTMINLPKFGYSSLAPYMNFDGINQYVSTIDDPQFYIQGTESTMENPGLTIGGWFYADTVAAGFHPLITKWQNVGQHSYAIYISTQTVKFVVSVDGTATANVDSSFLIPASKWFFVVGRFISSTSMDIWHNDVKSSNLVGIPAMIFRSNSQFEIARINGGNYFDGRASLCFLCASALSDTIINHIYQQTRALYGVR